MTTAFEWKTALIVFPVIFSLRVLLPGWAWSWLARGGDELEAKPRRTAVAAAWIVAIGLLVNSAVVFFLGEVGRYTPCMEWGGLVGVTIAGAALGVASKRIRGGSAGEGAFLAAVVLMGSAIMTMVAPQRGEWILGGWDPGVYVNEGVSVARTGTFHQPDQVFHLLEPGAEQHAFSRTDRGRTERFPGVAVDADRQAFTFQFSRLAPSLIAFLDRCGGLRAAVRVNLLVGVLCLYVFFVVLWRGSTLAHADLGALFLALQPVFLYHTHVPVSEMLQLFWILGMALALVSWECASVRMVLFPLALAAGVLNRFVFLPFAGILVLLAAWMDLDREDRLESVIRERLCQLCLLTASAAASAAVSGTSLAEWNFAAKLLGITILAGTGALVLDLTRLVPAVRNGLRTVRPASRWFLAGLVVLLLAGLYFRPSWDTLLRCFRRLDSSRECDNLVRLLPYIGYVATVLALVGGIVSACGRGGSRRGLCVTNLLFLGMTAVVVWKKEIADLYPWATRRYLDSTIPLVVILASCGCVWLWNLSGSWRRAGRILSVMAIAALCGEMVTPCRHAWKRTEYGGVSAALSQIADQIGNDDVVVADHPLWGTPLSMIYGKQVLNGQHFYRRGGPATAEIGLAALARLREQGRRVVFLSSIRAGLGIYPVPIQGAAEYWQLESFVTREIIHDPMAADFVLRPMVNTFRLFEWEDKTPQQLPR